MTRRPYKVAEVTWVDSCRTEGWSSLEGVAAPASIRSVGFLVSKNRTQISLALSIDLNESHYGLGQSVTIPMCSVKSVKFLEVGHGTQRQD